MSTETNTIDTLTKLASEHWNDTTVKVSKRNKSIVEYIEDHNQGHPNQENNGHYYRYTVRYINGVDYGCNTLEEIRSHIVTSGKYDYDDIIKEYFEDQETKPETTYTLLDNIKDIDKVHNITIISSEKRVKTGDKVVAFFPHLQYNEFKIIGIHYKSETVTIANMKGFIQSYNVSFEKLERDFKESFTEKPIKIKGAV